MTTGQTNAYYLFGGVSCTLGLLNLVGSYYPAGPLDRRKVMFHRGLLFTLLGSVCVLEPKFGVASLVKQAAIRFWLSPTNATVFALAGVAGVYYYHSYNSTERLGTIVSLMLCSAMAATQLALSNLTNENS